MGGCCRDVFVTCAVVLTLAEVGCVGAPPPLPTEILEETGTASATAVTDDNPANSTLSVDMGFGGYPVVTISNSETFDFGWGEIRSPTEHTFSIINIGNGRATNMEVAIFGEAFAKTSSNCGTTLDPGDICLVTVEFTPEMFGSYIGQLDVAFDGIGIRTSVTKELEGVGIGTTENLIVNGGGEEGTRSDSPPIGWLPYPNGRPGNWSNNQDIPAYMGEYSISAGEASARVHIIYQRVEANSVTTWGDLAGVRFRYRAYLRTESDDNDPVVIALQFYDYVNNGFLEESSDIQSAAVWTERVIDQEAPARTNNAWFLLVCFHEIGSRCSGYFDEVELVAEWSGG